MPTLAPLEPPLYRDLVGFLARLNLAELDGPPRPFQLIRGMTGHGGTSVAEGLVWPGGRTLMRWSSDTPTITAYEHVCHVEKIHGTDGRTVVAWGTRPLPLYARLIDFLARLNGEPHAFHLIRDEDTHGKSGIGVVAEGLAWPCGRTLMRWLSITPTISAYEHVLDVEAIHGHDERTYTEWLDHAPRAEPVSLAHP